jgi:hypothetical protein
MGSRKGRSVVVPGFVIRGPWRARGTPDEAGVRPYLRGAQMSWVLSVSVGEGLSGPVTGGLLQTFGPPYASEERGGVGGGPSAQRRDPFAVPLPSVVRTKAIGESWSGRDWQKAIAMF